MRNLALQFKNHYWRILKKPSKMLLEKSRRFTKSGFKLKKITHLFWKWMGLKNISKVTISSSTMIEWEYVYERREILIWSLQKFLKITQIDTFLQSLSFPLMILSKNSLEALWIVLLTFGMLHILIKKSANFEKRTKSQQITKSCFQKMRIELLWQNFDWQDDAD